MIVEQAVTNEVVDMGLLTQTAEPARDILGVETIEVVADRGYFKSEDIEACEKAGCIPHVPKPQRGSSVREGFFRKDEFRYDAGRDAYVCPAGQILTPIRHGRLRDLEKIDYGNPKVCRVCPLRARCTNDVRPEPCRKRDHVAPGRNRQGEDTDDRARSSSTVCCCNHRVSSACLMRGLENVRAEFSLSVLANKVRHAVKLTAKSR